MAETRIKLQKAIPDLDAIRAGAGNGATAVQSVNGLSPDASGDVQLSGDDIPITPGAGASVNESLQLLAADLRYAIDSASRDIDPETGAYQLSDRTINLVETSAAAVSLTFPAEVSGRGRDFFLVLNSTATVTGNVTLTITGGEDILTPDGNMPDTPLGKMTILYFSEIYANGFLFKAETVTTV